jgi:hypothetical protein
MTQAGKKYIQTRTVPKKKEWSNSPELSQEDCKIKTDLRGVDKFFKTLAKLASSSAFSLAKSENKWPHLYTKSVRGEKSTRQTGDWVCIFTRQAWILLAFGELASGYPHPCNSQELSEKDSKIKKWSITRMSPRKK